MAATRYATSSSASIDPVEAIDSLERQVTELRTQLAHAQRLGMLGTMAAAAAHEINNLLTPVLAYTQLARQNGEQAEFVQRALAKTEGGVDRASRIAESMLRLASPQHAGIKADAHRANLRSLVDDALESLPRPIDRQGIELTINVPDDIHAAIDPLHMQQVLLNLLLNAVDALRGQRNASIAIDALPRGGGRVELSVSDTGPGIPRAIRERIFEPFVSGPALGESENASAGQGRGLGLAVCRLLIDSAGGEIEVDSEPGRGTRFTLLLPEAAD